MWSLVLTKWLYHNVLYFKRLILKHHTTLFEGRGFAVSDCLVDWSNAIKAHSRKCLELQMDVAKWYIFSCKILKNTRPAPPQDIKLFSSSVFPASDLTESIISRLTHHFFLCWVCFHWVFHPTSRSRAPFTYHFSVSDPALSRALRNQTRWKRRAFGSPLNDSSSAGGQLEVLSRYFYKQPGMWDRNHSSL